MIWVILFFVCGFIGLSGLGMAIFGKRLAIFGKRPEDGYSENEPPVKTIGLVIAILTGIFFLALTAGRMIHVLDVKEVGVIKTFGRISGQTDCVENNQVLRCGGLILTAPWQTLDGWNVRENFIYANEEKCSNGWNDCVNAGSKDQQVVYIRPKLNVKVSPDNVQRLAAEVGTEYVEKIVRPLMLTTLKNITKDYEATDIHLKRDEVEAKIRDALRIEFRPYSIEVTRMTFEDLDFTEQYNKAIEAKVEQTQRALEEENKVKVIEQQANQRIAEALGIARANEIVANSISPILLQWEAMKRFNDNVTIALIPSGEGNLLDPSSFLRQLNPQPAPAGPAR